MVSLPSSPASEPCTRHLPSRLAILPSFPAASRLPEQLPPKRGSRLLFGASCQPGAPVDVDPSPKPVTLTRLARPSQSYNPDIQSPSEMVVDTDEFSGVANAPEQDHVAIINPENLDSEVDQLQDLPKATDRRPCPRGPSHPAPHLD